MLRLHTVRLFCLIVTMMAMTSSVIDSVHAAPQDNILFGLVVQESELVLLALDLNGYFFSQELLRVPREPDRRLTAFFQLIDGKLAFIDAAVKRNASDPQRSQTTILGTRDDIIRGQRPGTPRGVAGLQQDRIISSAVSTNINSLVTLTSHFADTPPYSLYLVDPLTGLVKQMLSRFALISEARYSNLTQCPAGEIYATSLSHSQGGTHLAQLDLKNGEFIDIAELQFNHKSLQDDVSSLACSPSGQLLALGDPTYQGVNSLFAIDIKTGDLEKIRTFDVDKITFGFKVKIKNDVIILKKSLIK